MLRPFLLVALLLSYAAVRARGRTPAQDPGALEMPDGQGGGAVMDKPPGMEGQEVGRTDKENHRASWQGRRRQAVLCPLSTAPRLRRRQDVVPRPVPVSGRRSVPTW